MKISRRHKTPLAVATGKVPLLPFRFDYAESKLRVDDQGRKETLGRFGVYPFDFEKVVATKKDARLPFR